MSAAIHPIFAGIFAAHFPVLKRELASEFAPVICDGCQRPGEFSTLCQHGRCRTHFGSCCSSSMRRCSGCGERHCSEHIFFNGDDWTCLDCATRDAGEVQAPMLCDCRRKEAV